MTLAGKSVVVTGAGGSIGSELCRKIARTCNRLTMVSLTESALYNIDRKLRPEAACELVPVLGSVLDTGLMQSVCAGNDIVIHAAAHKHVPICEQNVCEAIINNVGGTYSLALAALSAGVQQFVLISTDKAVRPASVMGATKRVAERVVANMGSSQYTGRPHFLTVRFGNVLDSFGSVLPLWREQIARGGPITITDAECERFFMSIPDAVTLILGALELDALGTFVFDMGAPRKIADMAQELVAHELATSGRDIQILFTGLRPGEKITEELHHGGTLLPTANPKILQVSGDPTPALSIGELALLLDLAKRRDTVHAKAKLFELAGHPVYDWSRAA